MVAADSIAAETAPLSGIQTAKPFHYLAIAPQANDLAALLEIVYTVQLLRKRQGALRSTALVHAEAVPLLEAFGIFDAIEVFDPVRVRAQIRRFRPDALYLPDRDLRLHLASAFSGAKLRIGGSRSRLLSALLRTYRLHQTQDLERMRKRGVDLFPELLDLRLSMSGADAPANAVWISLFDEHDLTGSWPAGHAARLARMVVGLGLRPVFPMPPVDLSLNGAGLAAREKMRNDLNYIVSKCPQAELIVDASPDKRARGMAAAAVVVAPAGPESVLAAMLGRPAVTLHDMKSHRDHPGLVKPAGLHDDGSVEGRVVALKDRRNLFQRALERLANEQSPLSSYLIRLSHSFERHVSPAVDECINACQACGFHSCVEYISPERVFEQIKKCALPF